MSSQVIEEKRQEWRSKIQIAFWGIVVICFNMQLFTVLLRLFAKRITFDELPVTVLKTILVPSLINSAIAFLAKVFNDSNIKDSVKNKAYVYGMMGLATSIVCFNGYVQWTFCIFALPIVLSVMFTDIHMTRMSFRVGMVFMYLSIFFAYLWDPNFDLASHLFVGILNVGFMVCVYLICKLIVEFLSQKNEIIRDYDVSNETLHHELTLDQMTSLYNHPEFNRVLESRFIECSDMKSTMTLVVADIDLFKNVNDTYGHEQGDIVLIDIAHQLMHFCSDKGQVFRYGGEEFAVIFMNQTANQVLSIMEEFRDSVSLTKYDFMPTNKNVTISVGIYEYKGETGMTAHEIFNRADEAMYEAKKSGRNRCYILK